MTPSNKVDTILLNAGNGPLVDLSMRMSFQLEDDDEVLAHKPLSGFLGEGVIANGDYLPTSEIIAEINSFIYTIDKNTLQEKSRLIPATVFG